MRMLLAALLSVSTAAPALAQQALTVVSSGPRGPVEDLEQAAEVRVVFSEPMVALGRAPAPASAAFFRIEPPLPGSLRWSGTDTLIFTPREGRLPWATRFDVSVAAGARAVSGAELADEHRFSFSTPALDLESAYWSREGDRFDSPVLIGVRFNQKIDADSLQPHLTLRYEPHPWAVPEGAPVGQAGWQAAEAGARAAAASAGEVSFEVPAEWDRRRFPPAEDFLVLRTLETPPPGTWLRVVLGPGAPSPAGPLTPGQPRGRVVQLEERFVVEGFRCREACDPDDWNPLRLRREVRLSQLAERIRVVELSPDGAERVLEPESREDGGDYATGWLSFDALGYRLAPARRYRVTLPAQLTAEDGQRLGYDWSGELSNAHRRPFSHFGGAHGVWETSGGTVLPFYAQNLEAVSYWLKPLSADELVPVAVALQEESYFRSAPQVPARRLALRPSPDVAQSFGLELAEQLGPGGHGLVWAALRPDEPIAGVAVAGGPPDVSATLVQVTGMGLSLKDSPGGGLVLVTRLDDGAPVAGARLSLRDVENTVLWQGESDAAGVARLPELPLRDADNYWQLRFFLIAEKEGDVAYLASDWNAGVEPWYFDLRYDLREAKPQLRGRVFADRGVYRLGESVTFKVVLRSDTAGGMKLLPPGTRVALALNDARGAAVAEHTLELSDWSSGEWRVDLPAEAPLGSWSVTASVADHPDPVSGALLVAAYRRPEFRVDAGLESAARLAGATLSGRIEGRYLFGAPMQGQQARWSVRRTPLHDVPAEVSDAFGDERWVFLEQSWRPDDRAPEGALLEDGGPLDDEGRRGLEVETETAAGLPYLYRLEAEVTDVSRQAIAGRAGFRVEAAPFYLGVRRPPYFADAGAALETEVVAVGLDGRPVAGVPVALELVRVQWHSVRRAEGGGYYTWESERREVEAGRFEVTSGDGPVAVDVPLGEGGYYELRASAGDGEGRSTRTSTGFYALGSGYTAWARHDHNRIDLVPERQRYRPGDTARILVQSPWESATALLTAEREGVRSYETFELTSTQQTLEVPISADDIPNLYVSVLLVKGRSAPFSLEDTSDPGRPAFRLGYVELEVEDESRRLDVSVRSDREEYRPGAPARIAVKVSDREGRPEPAEVTLWAVDYGVLSLTGFRTPDLLGSVYVPKALQVMNEDSRQNIISRRVMSSKGGEEGGGGGDPAAAGEVRSDFRALAFWLGSLETDADGTARAEVELPEGLTTWRVMAVAADRSSRFGQGDLEIRTSKPLLLAPAFPRLLGRGDEASFGAVVHSRQGGEAEVRFESLDPERLAVRGAAVRRVSLEAGGSREVRFDVAALAPGDARIRMRVTQGTESDAIEQPLPVRLLAPVSASAAYGVADPDALESLAVPASALGDVGGLEVELSSTALVGLGEGARYLVDYPWGCAEQRASATLALALAADLGGAFALPDVAPDRLRPRVAEAVAELLLFQCDDGAFGYWKGDCRGASPYLAAWVLHVLGRTLELGHPVAPEALERGYGWLELRLGDPEPATGRVARAAWQALAVKVLAEAGRNVDSPLTRLMQQLDRMPLFGVAYLLDAVTAAGGTPAWEQELERRLRNAILPEGGTAHVEELEDPELLWLWSTTPRSTAIALGSLVRRGAERGLTSGLARWLLQVRREGRWGNTQENAAALEALVAYYRLEESEPPEFEAVVRLAERELLRAGFRERSEASATASLPMAELLTRGEGSLPLSVRREGRGRLYYAARVTRADAGFRSEPVDAGIRLERRYAPREAGADAAGVTAFEAGDLVRVTLRLSLTKERRFVAVRDPLPAGLEPVESWFATTAADLTRSGEGEEEGAEAGWLERWRRGGFDHVERHDDRVSLFATRLAAGEHEFSYLARATTPGRFTAAPASAEEMYEPEVYGLTPSARIEVRP